MQQENVFPTLVRIDHRASLPLETSTYIHTEADKKKEDGTEKNAVTHGTLPMIHKHTKGDIQIGTARERQTEEIDVLANVLLHSADISVPSPPPRIGFKWFYIENPVYREIGIHVCLYKPIERALYVYVCLDECRCLPGADVLHWVTVRSRPCERARMHAFHKKKKRPDRRPREMNLEKNKKRSPTRESVCVF